MEINVYLGWTHSMKEVSINFQKLEECYMEGSKRLYHVTIFIVWEGNILDTTLFSFSLLLPHSSLKFSCLLLCFSRSIEALFFARYLLCTCFSIPVVHFIITWFCPKNVVGYQFQRFVFHSFGRILCCLLTCILQIFNLSLVE